MRAAGRKQKGRRGRAPLIVMERRPNGLDEQLKRVKDAIHFAQSVLEVAEKTIDRLPYNFGGTP